MKPKKKIRIKDIAELAGVSIGTVDRVIHNRGEVSEKTRNKILSIIKEMDFEPDILASTLASKRSFRFAVLFPEVTQESIFWKSPLYGLEKALAEIGHYGVTIERFLFDPFSSDSFYKQGKKLLDFDPDAFLLAPVYHEEAAMILKGAHERNIPYAFVNSNMEGIDSLCYIGQDSFQSGRVAAKIMGLAMPDEAKILVVNISKNLSNHKHILKRQMGFNDFFNDNQQVKIHRLDLEITEQNAVNHSLHRWYDKYGAPDGVFVTNSRVYKIADYHKKNALQNIFLMGYDLLDENVVRLEEGVIDFLISQKPIEQGYRGIMSLYNHVILHKDVQPLQHLPIDIITNENIRYYLNS